MPAETSQGVDKLIDYFWLIVITARFHVLHSLLDQHQQMNLQSGLVVAVPIPDEHAAAGNPIEEAIQKSLAEAKYVFICCCFSIPFYFSPKLLSYFKIAVVLEKFQYR